MRRTLAWAGVALGLLAAAPGAPEAEDARSALLNGFTADIVTHSEADGRSTSLTGTLYFAKDRMRLDMTVGLDGPQQPGLPSSMAGTEIVRVDRHTAWMLMPQQRLYMEVPVKPQDEARVAAMSQDWTALKPVGTEMVDGQLADKYDQSTEQCAVYTYVSSSTHLPLKTEAVCAETHVVTEFTNVRLGAPPAGLFELPSGYQKFDPEAMLKMGRKLLGQRQGGDSQ